MSRDILGSWRMSTADDPQCSPSIKKKQEHQSAPVLTQDNERGRECKENTEERKERKKEEGRRKKKEERRKKKEEANTNPNV